MRARGQAARGRARGAAAGDARPQLRRLEQYGLAAEAQDLADEPFLAADRALADADPSSSSRAPRSTCHRAMRSEYQITRRPGVLELARIEPGRGSNGSSLSAAWRIRSSRNERSPPAVRSHVCTYQCGSSRSIEYGSTTRRDDAWSLSFRYSISTSLFPRIPSVSVATRSASAPAVRLGRLPEIELAERLLELAPHAVERGVRCRRDRRADELERETDRPRLERREPRRRAKRVAEQLLVDVHVLASQLGIDRITAAAEVDEVEQRQVFLEVLPRDVEPLDELVGGDRRLRGCRRTRRAGTRAGPGGRRSARVRPARRVAPAPTCASSSAASAATCGDGPSCRVRTSVSASATPSRSSGGETGTARPSCRSTQETSWSRLAYGVTKAPSSSRPWWPYVRSTHHAVSPCTSIRASPTTSPICHGGRSRWAAMSKSCGVRKCQAMPAEAITAVSAAAIRATAKERIDTTTAVIRQSCAPAKKMSHTAWRRRHDAPVGEEERVPDERAGKPERRRPRTEQPRSTQVGRRPHVGPPAEERHREDGDAEDQARRLRAALRRASRRHRRETGPPRRCASRRNLRSPAGRVARGRNHSDWCTLMNPRIESVANSLVYVSLLAGDVMALSSWRWTLRSARSSCSRL